MQAVRQVWQIDHRVLILVLYYGWVYINDLQVSNYKTVKYADDTSFYLAVNKNAAKSVASAIEHTSHWSSMLTKRWLSIFILIMFRHIRTQLFSRTQVWTLLTWWSFWALRFMIILQRKTEFNEAAGKAWYEFDSIMYHLLFKHYIYGTLTEARRLTYTVCPC